VFLQRHICWHVSITAEEGWTTRLNKKLLFPVETGLVKEKKDDIVCSQCLKRLMFTFSNFARGSVTGQQNVVVRRGNIQSLLLSFSHSVFL